MSSASGVGGLYNRDTNTIYVSSALSTDEAVDFVLKHEITHSIETTQAWSKMESLARQTMGEEAYAAAVREVMAQRQAVGDTTGATETGAKKEVIADWVGKNLWKNNFAAIVAAKDKGLANKLALTMWNIRRGLSFTENGRQTARVKYAEQLLMKAIEDTARTDPALELNTPSDPNGAGQYSVAPLDDDLVTFFNDVLAMEDESKTSKRKHRIGKISENLAHLVSDAIYKATGERVNFSGYEQWIDGSSVIHINNRHGVNGKADQSMQKPEDIGKIPWVANNAEVGSVLYDGEVIQRDSVYENSDQSKAIQVRVEKKIGNDIFFVTECAPDSIAKRLYIKSAYIQKGSSGQESSLVNTQRLTPETVLDGTATNTNVPQNAPGVNTQSMQNGEKNSSSGQLSFLPPEMAASDKPDVYQEDGEREAYLAEDEGDTSSASLRSAPSPQGEGYDGAIDENVPRLSFTADFEADVIRRFGITKMNDYIHVQKQVKEALPDSFFVPVQNWRSGMVVNITRKGINETFNKDTFEKIPHSLQIAKLATVELIPEAIANGTYVKEVPNYHNASNNVRYAYIYYDIVLQGQPCQLKIDVRMSLKSKSNRLHVHSVVLTNENIGGRAEVDIQENDARPNLPPISQTVYSGGEDLSSASQNDEYELVNQEVFLCFPIPENRVDKFTTILDKFANVFPLVLY